jgi:hypothetical protein
VIEDKSVIKGNQALNYMCGGGFATYDNSTVIVRGHTLIDSNSASAPGGAIATFAESHLEMTQVIVTNNRALALSGGGAVGIFDRSRAVFTDCLFESNSVHRGAGGAIGVFNEGVLGVSEAVVNVSGCVFKNNSTPEGPGGGLFCTGDHKVLIANNTRFLNNTGAFAADESCTAFIGGGTTMVNNTVPIGSAGGGISVTGSAMVSVGAKTLIQGNKALEGAGGGGVYIIGSGAVVLDSVRLVGNDASNGGGVAALGSSRLTIKGSTVISNNTAPVGQDISVGPNATFSIEGSSVFDPYGDTVSWQRVDCLPGEVLSQGYCRPCLPSTYSLVPGVDAMCKVCPANAVCPAGADVIIPVAGHWHSSRYSTQIHRCPHVDEVCGLNGTCAAGYNGNLCGACEPGYGPAAAFNCGKCMSPAAQWALYISAGLIAVLLVSFTVHSTWRDNTQTSPSRTVKASDLIKVLILFLQYLVIVSSLSVPWPTSLAYLFRGAKFVFAASNGQVVSLDCVLFQGHLSSPVPIAIQRQLLYLVAPIGVLLGLSSCLPSKLLSSGL